MVMVDLIFDMYIDLFYIDNFLNYIEPIFMLRKIGKLGKTGGGGGRGGGGGGAYKLSLLVILC